MPTTQPALILFDNTVLSNFALVKQTDLVLQLWPDSSTTVDAWGEYQAGVALGYLPKETWTALPRIKLNDTEVKIAQQLVNTLGAGERTCIAVAKNRRGLFVTDDRKARQVALEMGVKVTGTLGILVVAVERKVILIDEANRLLARMIEYGYRSPIDQLNKLPGRGNDPGAFG
jgi:predicted nucleic acid-binding protein